MCVWECSLAITFRNVEDQFTWAFAGIYGPNSIWIEGSFGKSWLDYTVGGICLSALGVISTLPDSLVRDRVKLVYAVLW